jgi:DNA-binding transcriptional MerR regulator
MAPNQDQFSLDQLCALTGLPKRTVRYYMQIGLVDRPQGETKGAYYLARHLDQLMQVKGLVQAGVNLERIRQVLDGAQAPVAARQPTPGDVAVRSHVHIAPGIELSIDPQLAGLSADEMRKLIQAMVNTAKQLK